MKNKDRTKELVHDILMRSCEINNINFLDSLKKTRKHEVIKARYMAYYCMVHFTNLTYNTISHYVLKQDHSTISYVRKKVPDLMATDKEYRAKIETLERYTKRRFSMYKRIGNKSRKTFYEQIKDELKSTNLMHMKINVRGILENV